jgi:hypothetical protein
VPADFALSGPVALPGAFAEAAAAPLAPTLPEPPLLLLAAELAPAAPSPPPVPAAFALSGAVALLVGAPASAAKASVGSMTSAIVPKSLAFIAFLRVFCCVPHAIRGCATNVRPERRFLQGINCRQAKELIGRWTNNDLRKLLSELSGTLDPVMRAWNNRISITLDQNQSASGTRKNDFREDENRESRRN